MKKLILFACVLSVNLTVNAQQKKKTPAKSSSSATSTAMTKADANTFITYTNSLQEFFGSRYKVSDFINSYNYLKDFDDNGVRSNISVTDFDDAYTEFNSAHGNGEGKEYVALDKIPAKIGAEKIARIKTSIEKIRTAHRDLAEYYLNTLLPKYKNGFPKKSNKTVEENDKFLEVYKTKIQNILVPVREINSIAEEIGDMSEEITLASHPQKDQILELRSTIKMVRNLCSLFDVREKETLLANEAKIQQYLSVLKEKYAKYENLNTSTKDRKLQAMNEKLKDIHTMRLQFLFDAVEEAMGYAKEKETHLVNFQEKANMVTRYSNYFLQEYNDFVGINNSNFY